MLWIAPSPAVAQGAGEIEIPLPGALTLDERIDAVFQPIAESASNFIFYSVDFLDVSWPLVLIWLMAASVFFTIYFGFINIRYFFFAFRLLLEPLRKKNKLDRGEINRFQALSTSLSGTLGLGNIAGVAIAISMGGPGAMIWMIIMGLFGMTTKFVEIAEAVKYRQKNAAGEYSGGPMYYLRDGLRERGLPRLGWAFGALYSVCCIGGAFGAGNMFQANQIFEQFVVISGGDQSFLADKGWLVGLILALLVAAVIVGGIRSIADFASKAIPSMVVIYLTGCFGVVFLNFEQIPHAFQVIFQSAFGLDAFAGGLFGALVAGVRRAVFSNEAGLGTASIAHAAVKTDSHISQGIVGLLEPFIDTVIICTMTALVIVISGVYIDSEGARGVELTSRAFGETFAFFPYILAISVFLFAFTTMVTWSYYGLKSCTFLFGHSKMTQVSFNVLYCCFIVVGAAVQMNSVIDFMDAAVFAMTIPNIIGLYILTPSLKREVKAYMAKKKS